MECLVVETEILGENPLQFQFISQKSDCSHSGLNPGHRDEKPVAIACVTVLPRHYTYATYTSSLLSDYCEPTCKY
jgi:hypothetical protein